MFGAEFGFHELQRLLEERQGQVRASRQPAIRHGEIVMIVSVSGSSGPSFAFEFQRLLEERQGQVPLPGIPIRLGEVVHAGERVGIVGAEVLPVQGRGPLQEPDRPFVLSHTEIRTANRLQNLRLDQRLVREVRVDLFRHQFLGGTVEQFANGRVLLRLRRNSAARSRALAWFRVGLAEQLVLQEVPHRLGDLLLLLRFLFARLSRLLPLGLGLLGLGIQFASSASARICSSPCACNAICSRRLGLPSPLGLDQPQVVPAIPPAAPAGPGSPR